MFETDANLGRQKRLERGDRCGFVIGAASFRHGRMFATLDDARLLFVLAPTGEVHDQDSLGVRRRVRHDNTGSWSLIVKKKTLPASMRVIPQAPGDMP